MCFLKTWIHPEIHFKVSEWKDNKLYTNSFLNALHTLALGNISSPTLNIIDSSEFEKIFLLIMICNIFNLISI